VDDVLRSLAVRTGTTPRVVQRINDFAVTEDLVAAGRGVALLPRFSTQTGAGGGWSAARSPACGPRGWWRRCCGQRRRAARRAHGARRPAGRGRRRGRPLSPGPVSRDRTAAMRTRSARCSSTGGRAAPPRAARRAVGAEQDQGGGPAEQVRGLAERCAGRARAARRGAVEAAHPPDHGLPPHRPERPAVAVDPARRCHVRSRRPTRKPRTVQPRPQQRRTAPAGERGGGVHGDRPHEVAHGQGRGGPGAPGAAARCGAGAAPPHGQRDEQQHR
jgi:hypothetical protein